MPTDSEFRQSLAIVVGIDRYAEAIPDLRTAVNDARRVGSILGGAHGYDVRFLLDEAATHDGLRTLLLEDLPRTVGSDDRVFFYFAGHGVALDGDEGPNGFLLPHDARRGQPETYLQMPLVHDALLALPCRHMLVVLDSCFAGAFRWSSLRDLTPLPGVIHRERYDRFLRDPAWQVITSSAHDQTALDQLLTGTLGSRGDEGGHSPFALSLFEALEGKGDVVPEGGDGVITATELYLYLEQRLQGETLSLGLRQTPRLWPLRKHDKGEYIFLAPGRAPDLPPAPPLTFENNPYRGLSAYDREHTDLFFGRSAVVASLAAHVARESLTVVLGASGTGKSSLVKAGLVPRLEDAGWRVVGPVRPGTAPLHALAKALGMVAPEPDAIAAAIAALCTEGPGPGVLLVIDQLEELVTLVSSPELREHTLALLARLVEEHPDRLRIVLTLRSDFEAQFDRSVLGAAWLRGRFTVTPPARADLREIIERPASLRVIYFEPAALVDELLDAVVATPGGLPLLSFTLSEMYVRYVARRSDDRALTKTDYDDLGGVAGALRSRADAEFDALDPAQQATMRRVMLRMVVPERDSLARRRVTRAELEYADPAENDRVREVIDRLTSARLLVEGTEADGVAYVEPAHDALVRGWGRLLAWIHEEDARATGLRFQHELARTATDWMHADSRTAAGLLWRDPVRSGRLAATLKDDAVLLNRHELEFATRSVRRRRAIRRGLAALVSVIFVAGVLATVLGIVAEGQRREAVAQRDEAVRQTLRAQSNQLAAQAVLALDGTGDATQAAKLAAAALRTDSANVSARNTLLRAMYGGLFTYRGRMYARPFHHVFPWGEVAWAPDGRHLALSVLEDPWETLVLALDGTLRARVPGVFHGFSQDGRFFSAEGQAYDLDGVPVSAAAMNRAGDESDPFEEDVEHFIAADGILNDHSFEFIGARSAYGAVRGAMDLERGGFVIRDAQGDEITAIPGSWSYADFSADGRYLVTGSLEGQVVLWELPSERFVPIRQVVTLGGHADAIYSADFSPDETHIVTTSRDGTVRLWMLTGRPIESLSPGRERFVHRVWSDEDAATIIGVGNGALVRTAGADSARWLEGTIAAFSPDAQRIAVAVADTTVRITDGGGRPIASIPHAKPIEALAFTAAGELLSISGGSITLHDSLGAVVYSQPLPPSTGPALFPTSGRNVLLQRADSALLLDLENGAVRVVAAWLRYSDAAVSLDGRFAALRITRDTAGVLDTQRGEIVARLGREFDVELDGISDDGHHVLVRENNVVLVWDWRTDRLRVADGGFQVERSALAPNGLLATHAIDGVIRVWDTDGRRIVGLDAGTEGDMGWIAGGRYLYFVGISGSADGGSILHIVPIATDVLLTGAWGGVDTLSTEERVRWAVEATSPADPVTTPSSLPALLWAGVKALLLRDDRNRDTDEPAVPTGETLVAWSTLDSLAPCGASLYTARGYLSCALHAGTLKLLSEAAGEPIFLEGPHGPDGFAPFATSFSRYNPAFLDWAVETLVPAADDPALVRLVSPIYQRMVRKDARTYWLARRALSTRPDLVAGVRAAAPQQPDPGRFMFDALAEIGDSVEARHGLDPVQATWAATFWVRRDLDDTADLFAAGLDTLLARFDSEFVVRALGPDTRGSRAATPAAPTVMELWGALDRDDECSPEESGSGIGFGLRDRYCAVARSGILVRLARIAGQPVFVSGPHSGAVLDLRSEYEFGRYNPGFVRWARETLIPAPGATAAIALASPVYRSRLQNAARAYWIMLRALEEESDVLAELTDEYQWQLDPRLYVIRHTRDIVSDIRDRLGNEAEAHAYVAGPFWVRRTIDGSRDEFAAGLRTLLERFDAEFLASAAPAPPRD